MAPWGRGPPVAPLHPGVDTQRSREFGDSPFTVVDLDLDRGDAACLGPGHTGDDDRSGRAVLSEAGNVDSRLGLNRRLLGPSAFDPEGVNRVQGCQLDLGEPLCR